MTRDDDFITHLQDMARTTPPVPVDRARVLRAGRRRRLLRASGISTLAVVAVAASAAGVQALLPTPQDPAPLAERGTSPSPAATQTSPPAPAGVVFDPASDTVSEPIDAWMWTQQEWAIATAAKEHFRTECLTSKGVPGYEDVTAQISVPVIPTDGFTTYGLWDQSQVDTIGYEPRPDSGDVAPPGAYPHVTDDDDLDLALECVAAAEEADLLYDSEKFRTVGPVGTDPLNHTDEGEAVIRAWVQCVQDGGVEASDDLEGFYGLVPTAAPDAAPAERSRIAAVDLGCKDQLGSVQALADLQARVQNEYIARAEDHLIEVKATQDRVLAAATAYLTDHGIDIPATTEDTND